MKISWQWLSQSGFIKPWPATLTPADVAEQLTMAGLELEQLEQADDGDTVLELNITPNRGDCLSARGICREIAALNDVPFHDVAIESYKKLKVDNTVAVAETDACPVYSGQWFSVPSTLNTLPLEFSQALTAAGMVSVNPIVDLTNYVMLLVGQPLHAFDAEKITSLTVRLAKFQESFTALGNRDLSLTADTLVIADAHGVQAIAGVIGGVASAVTDGTREIFVESAHFKPAVIAGKARRYGLQTDAAYRFERGVDPALPWVALQLFKALAVKHLGLTAGKVTLSGDLAKIVAPEPIVLLPSRIERLLGFEMRTGQVEKILQALGMAITAKAPGWQVTPPTCRFDIALEADLIEELVRIHGYQTIPAAPLVIGHVASQQQRLEQLTSILQHSAYHEVISYSFISDSLHEQCFEEAPAIRLQNPLSKELAVMRLSLWPSLLQTYSYNQARQQTRAKLYESGRIYRPEVDPSTGTYAQPRVLAGLLTGTAHREEWGAPSRTVDFYDLKADVEKLLRVFAPLDHYRFVPEAHGMLHPGQSAAIYVGETRLGFLGLLHPELQQTLDLEQPVFLFELLIDALPTPSRQVFKAFSKFPTIKRNFAFFVKRDVPMQAFCAAIKACLGDVLVDLRLFDVYQGKGVASDEKSVAFSVTLEDAQQTWTDAAIQQWSDRLVTTISQQFGAKLRDGSG